MDPAGNQSRPYPCFVERGTLFDKFKIFFLRQWIMPIFFLCNVPSPFDFHQLVGSLNGPAHARPWRGEIPQCRGETQPSWSQRFPATSPISPFFPEPQKNICNNEDKAVVHEHKCSARTPPEEETATSNKAPNLKIKSESPSSPSNPHSSTSYFSSIPVRSRTFSRAIFVSAIMSAARRFGRSRRSWRETEIIPLTRVPEPASSINSGRRLSVPGF